MSFVGNSRPASGSEHHLSHFFEITGIVHNRPYLPHGIDVAYSAIATAMLRRQILEGSPKKRPFDYDSWEQTIRQIYGSVAQGVIDLQNKLDSYKVYAGNTMNTNWQQIRDCLAEAPNPEEMSGIIESIGLQWEDFEAFYGKQVLEDATYVHQGSLSSRS